METKKKRVLFDARSLTNSLKGNSQRTGIYFTVYNIFDIIFRDERLEVILYAQDLNAMKEYLRRYFPERVGMPMTDTLRGIGRVDAYFSPNEPAGYWVKDELPDVSCFSIVYDVIPILFPEFYPGWQDAVWKQIERCGDEDHLFAISQCTKNDIVRMGRIDPDRLSVIPLGANDHFHPDPDPQAFARIREKYRIPAGKKYALSLCTKEPRKNLLNAVRAFVEFVRTGEHDDIVFVLAGGTWKMFREELRKGVANLDGYEDKIVNVGYVADEDLAVLYSNAMWFVFTSTYEGFGLPPLEAMQCGCPVVTSTHSSLPEVVGDSAITVDSQDIAGHVRAYEDFYRRPELREEYRRKGLERAKLFSWRKCTEIICDAICEQVDRKRGTPPVTLMFAANFGVDGDDPEAAAQSMRSIMEQSYSSTEILVLDGARDAAYSRKLEELAAASGATVRPAADQTACGAVSSLLDSISGEYVVLWTPGLRFATSGHLANCVGRGLEFGADLIFCDTLTLHGDAASLKSADMGRLPFGEYFHPGAALMKTSVLRRLGGFSLTHGSAAFDEMIMRMIKNDCRPVYVRGTRIVANKDAWPAIDPGEYSRAYYDVFGEEQGISLDEARLLYGSAYLKSFSSGEIMDLAKKLPTDFGCSAMVKSCIERQYLPGILDAERRREVTQNRVRLLGCIPCTMKYSGDSMASNTSCYMFNFFPLFRIRRRERKRATWYLFGFLPLFRTQIR